MRLKYLTGRSDLVSYFWDNTKPSCLESASVSSTKVLLTRYSASTERGTNQFRARLHAFHLLVGKGELVSWWFLLLLVQRCGDLCQILDESLVYIALSKVLL